MDLTRAIQYAIQTGRSRSISFKWLFPLTGSRASESGIDCRILVLSPLLRRFGLLRCCLLLTSLLSEVSRFLDVLLLRASQLSSPMQKRVMRFVNAAIVLVLFWPRCLASHSSRTLCLKAAKASASGQSTIWFFLVRNLFQSFQADSPGC